MNTLGLLIITLSISTSIFYTVYCTCGVTYLSSCQPGVYQPSSEHISRTELVGNYAQCIELCNSYKNECLSLDLRSFNNGSYSCQMFNTLGRSNCGVLSRTKHYVRVRNSVFKLWILSKSLTKSQTVLCTTLGCVLKLTLSSFWGHSFSSQWTHKIQLTPRAYCELFVRSSQWPHHAVAAVSSLCELQTHDKLTPSSQC